jgi:hypothetical protein
MIKRIRFVPDESDFPTTIFNAFKDGWQAIFFMKPFKHIPALIDEEFFDMTITVRKNVMILRKVVNIIRNIPHFKQSSCIGIIQDVTA